MNFQTTHGRRSVLQALCLPVRNGPSQSRWSRLGDSVTLGALSLVHCLGLTWRWKLADLTRGTARQGVSGVLGNRRGSGAQKGKVNERDVKARPADLVLYEAYSGFCFVVCCKKCITKTLMGEKPLFAVAVCTPDASKKTRHRREVSMRSRRPKALSLPASWLSPTLCFLSTFGPPKVTLLPTRTPFLVLPPFRSPL